VQQFLYTRKIPYCLCSDCYGLNYNATSVYILNIPHNKTDTRICALNFKFVPINNQSSLLLWVAYLTTSVSLRTPKAKFCVLVCGCLRLQSIHNFFSPFRVTCVKFHNYSFNTKNRTFTKLEWASFGYCILENVHSFLHLRVMCTYHSAFTYNRIIGVEVWNLYT